MPGSVTLALALAWAFFCPALLAAGYEGNRSTAPVAVEAHAYKASVHEARRQIDAIQEEEALRSDGTLARAAAAADDKELRRLGFGAEPGSVDGSPEEGSGVSAEEPIIGPSSFDSKAKRMVRYRGGGKVGPRGMNKSNDISRQVAPAQAAPEAAAIATDLATATDLGIAEGVGTAGEQRGRFSAASAESIFDQCIREGLCSPSSRTTSRRTFLLASTLFLVVMVSFKIGLQLGSASIKLYHGAMESLEDIPKRTAHWKQTPEEILAEVYAKADGGMRGLSEKACLS